MSINDAKAVRRELMRVLHPDKADVSKLTEPQRQLWNVFFGVTEKMSESLVSQLERKADIKVTGGKDIGK